MAAGVGPGDGTTIVFGGNLYVPTNISFDGASVKSIGTGGLADSIVTYTAGNLKDWGTITIEVEYSGKVTVPTLGGDGVALEIIVRADAADNFSTKAYVESWAFNVPEGDKMTGTMVCRLTEALVDAT